MVMEAHIDRAFAAIEELASKTNQLADTTKAHGEIINGPLHNIEGGLAWRVNDVYKVSKRWAGVAWAVVTAAAIALTAIAVQLYGSRMK
jgi:Na+/alanine symporter